MPATPFPGTGASVVLPQGAYTFDAFVLTVTTDKADVSDYDRVAARFLPGAASASVVLSGPLTDDGTSTAVLGLLAGNEYDVTLNLSASVGLTVAVQVEACRLIQRKDDVARVEVNGVVNSDFLTDPDLAALLDVEDRTDTSEVLA